jgi:type I restriction enzyme S subunit
MNRDLKPYPEYKDSGVPWLGKVPAHWGMKRGKWLFRSMKEINADRQHTNILSLTLRGVVNNDPDDPEGLVPKDYGTYQLFAKGDLVFKLIDLENLRTSRVGLVHEDGIMSPAYVRLVPRHNGVQRFFFRQYFDLYQRGIFNQLGAGVRATLGPKDLLELPVVVPNVSEQSAIVRFLDHVDRKIKKHIRAKQKLIKLLTEQKQAIIQRAVTRGLDPNVRLKPSGVEWLGDVPQHWKVRRVKSFVSNIADQTTAMSSDDVYIALENVESWTGRVKPQRRQDEYLFIGQVKRFQANDVLFGKLRPYLAKVITASSPGVCVGEFFVLRGDGSLVASQFLELLLRTSTVIDVINSSTFGAKMPRADWHSVGNLRLALPPVHEQKAIIESIDWATNPLAKTIARFDREVELLREYRTRLIADVVTGKLDVREAAANLPEEAEEAEVLDEPEAQTEGGEDGDAGEADAAAEEMES